MMKSWPFRRASEPSVPPRESRGVTAAEDAFIRSYVAGCQLPPPLDERVLAVLITLPAEVRDDLLHDPCFQIRLDTVERSRRIVHIALPEPAAAGGRPWRGSRSVVLKPRLATCSEMFAAYVIAHELAHAHLWNGGWGQITDREQAADALAEHWGFPRPNWWG